jgi:hypothetical protein
MSDKRKILQYTLWPFGIALIIYGINLFTTQSPGLKGVTIGMFIGHLLNLLLWPKSFVNSIEYDSDKLTLGVKNALLKPSEKSFSLDEISQVRLNKKMFFLRDFNELRFNYKGSDLTFNLIGELTKEHAEALVRFVSDPIPKRLDNDFQLEFTPPWENITDYPQSNAEGLLEELHKELHPAHALYSKNHIVLARRQDNDDILIQLEDGRVAVVHLTWSGKKESGPWPSTSLYSDKEDFRQNRMKKDIEEFK